MCHFVTLIVAGGADDRVAAIAKRHGRRAVPLRNASVERQLRGGERQYATTVSHCDCGTVLAPQGPDEQERAAELDANIVARRAQGWSDAKLARWLADKRKSAQRERARSAAGGVDTTEVWRGLLRDLLAEPDVPRAGLLVRFYGGDVETEVFAARREVSPLSSFQDRVRAFPPDTAVMFTVA